jgi:tripartite ATP-independent transporter DctM subunit
MDNLTLGLSGIGILVIISFLGIPLAISIASIGLIGSLYVSGTSATFHFVGMYINSNVANYTLTAVPLFLLMGQLIAQSGVSTQLYITANKWLGRLPAGLSIVTIVSCAVFSACCGSSQATAGTLGIIAIPQMKKHRYKDKLVAGSLAAGGTLGILIPPSLVFILYGIVAEQSVGKLFIAGILPGLLLSLLFVATAVIWASLSKGLAPPSPQSYSLKEKIRSIPGVSGILLLFLFVLGGIYGGIFTPTEAAACGSFAAFIMMLAKKKLSKQSLGESMMATARTTGMLYLMIIGAFLFQFFVAQTQLTQDLVQMLETGGIHRYGVLLIVLGIFILLGFVLDAVAMMILIVPIVAPVIEALGFDLIWFGVIMVVVIEMSFITPPVGFNLFVIKSTAPEISTADLYAGIFPFLAAQLVCLAMLIVFPNISLFLPGRM